MVVLQPVIRAVMRPIKNPEVVSLFPGLGSFDKMCTTSLESGIGVTVSSNANLMCSLWMRLSELDNCNNNSNPESSESGPIHPRAVLLWSDSAGRPGLLFSYDKGSWYS